MKRSLTSRVLALFFIIQIIAFSSACNSDPATAFPTQEKLTQTPITASDSITTTISDSTDTNTPERGINAVVIAGSDFQNPSAGRSADANGKYYLTPILEQIKDYYDGIGLSVNGLIFGGDYNYYEYEYDEQNTKSGIMALQSILKSVLGDNYSKTFIQGNHDAVCDLISSTGAHDSSAYGIFVINEDDYQQGDMVNEELNKSVAEKLSAYFAEKAAIQYTKPIFVCSHVPLHASARSSKDYIPGDAKYAKYIFDVLNEYGERLNIIYMYGHNHSNGWDSYLGGSTVYLKPGDKINIFKPGNNIRSTPNTLNFTYMNYGYTGYYWFGGHSVGSLPNCDENSPADNTLTMSSFEITDDTVTVRRFSSQGEHDLKYPGQWNLVKLGSSTYEKYNLGITVNGTRYESGQVIKLIRPYTCQDDETGVCAAAYSKEKLTIGITSSIADISALDAELSNAKGYRIDAFGAPKGALYQLSFPAQDLSDLRTRVYLEKDGTLHEMETTVIGGRAIVYTESFGTFVVGEASDIEQENWQFTEDGSSYIYTLDTDGPDDKAHYIIVAPNDNVLLPVSKNGITVGGSSTLDGIEITLSDDGITATTDSRFNEWTTSAASGTNPIKNGSAISGLWFFNGNNYYLKLGSGTATTFGYSQSPVKTDNAFTVRGDGKGNYQIIRYYPTNFASGELWYNGSWTSYRPTLYNGGDFSTGYPDGFNGVGFGTPAYAPYEARYVRLYKFEGTQSENKNYYALEGSRYIVNAGTDSSELIEIIKNSSHLLHNTLPTLTGATDCIKDAEFNVIGYSGESGSSARVELTIGSASFTVSVNVK